MYSVYMTEARGAVVGRARQVAANIPRFLDAVLLAADLQRNGRCLYVYAVVEDGSFELKWHYLSPDARPALDPDRLFRLTLDPAAVRVQN